ncbi:MAG: diaminopimelate epimerase, partial [Kiritimatiellia bacterium]
RSATADFRMRFFNPDGSEAEFCGNGARCVAAFAREIGAVASDAMRFETLSGEVRAEIVGPELVRIWLPDPKDLRENFVNSGVPHCIVPVADLAGIDVAGEGRRIRRSARFAPAGTNVDFVRYRAPHGLDVRTYERGVEAETGACGSGSVAAALVGVAQYGLAFPVKVRTARGYDLTVDGVFDGAAFSSVTLTGPVRRVYAAVYAW